MSYKYTLLLVISCNRAETKKDRLVKEVFLWFALTITCMVYFNCAKAFVIT